MNCSIIPTKP